MLKTKTVVCDVSLIIKTVHRLHSSFCAIFLNLFMGYRKDIG